ncbi:MFS transporter [Micromonospora sp. CPCC 205711]|uniref:MFS transporter n=1 Tax=Micromonospora sp. CPCC 205547 TaxID=3122400 RepID=UPI002FF1E6A8
MSVHATQEEQPDTRPDGRSWTVRRGLLPESRPQRVLALATFVNMVGNGLFMVSSALFFTRSVGLSVTQVGLGMGVAAVVGLLAGVPVGHVADRRGPREVYLLTLCAQAVMMAALVFVHSFGLFVAALCLGELARAAGAAARGPLVRQVGGNQLARYRSYLRSVGNLAGSGAAVAAGFAVQLDSRPAYLALVLGNAVSFLACAAVITALPSLPPLPVPSETGRWSALRDCGYLAVTALDGVLSIHHQVLLFALPLWIVGNTDAPRWLVGGAALVNTALVVLLQVRASRGVDDTATAARVIRRSGVAFLVGMAAMAAAAGLPGRLAAALVVAGICVHTVGELWHTAGSLELRFALAPAHAQGQYSGLFGFGSGLAGVAAPSVLALCCLTWGAPGWLLLGGVFVAVGLVMPAVVRAAERRRPYAP